MSEWLYKIQPLNVSSDFMVAQADMDQITQEGWEIFAVYNHPVMLLRKKNDGSTEESFSVKKTEPKKNAEPLKASSPGTPENKTRTASAQSSNTQAAVPFYHKGTSLLSQEKFQAAIEEYNKALELDPNFTMAYIFRANAKLKTKDWDSAIEDFNKALSLKPNDASCTINRGICRYENGDIKSAIEDFNTVIQVNPQNSIAYEYRGQSFKKLKDYENAGKDFSKLIDDFKDPLGYLLRGDIKIETKDYQGAMEDYSAIIKHDAQNAMAYFKRSKAYKLLGDDEEAKKDLKKYNELFAKNAQAKEVTWGESAPKPQGAPAQSSENKGGEDELEVVE